jgi:hypothetical protein
MVSSPPLEDRVRQTSTWREAILQEVDRVQTLLDRSGKSAGDAKPVSEPLELARRTVSSPRDWFSSFRARWSGADIERAWRSVHRAKQELFLVAREEDVRSMLPALRAKVERYVTTKTEREKYETWLTEMEKSGSTLDREQLRETRNAVDRESDQGYENIRRFRNALLAAFVGASILLVVLAFSSGWVPGLPLCGAEGSVVGEEETVEPASVATHSSPTSQPSPSPGGQGVSGEECVPAWQVELVGAAGALIAAAAAFWGVPKSGEPFGLRGVQAVVKVPMGALMALVGTMLLQGEVIDALDPQPVPEVLAYAAVFGFAQQVVTRFIDNKATTLLKSPEKTEAKEEEA